MSFFFATIFTSVLLAVTKADTLGYDDAYGNAGASLQDVACSTGSNGLITKGFNTFGDLPTFPAIGSAYVVDDWNSAGCGTCWNLEYTNSTGQKLSITFTAIDVSGGGFYTSVNSLDYLTGGNGEQWGVIDVTATEVDASACGL
ncbi:eliciting plant response-like protein [Cylindrobasidium torrendii FP15055 ss-10]|uniref:Eliciting plant response-like protein n=1 Tax=Cylindrobasidium torrendii FP15055 ss-10 TaxID=1314674 RepID=A0A0D7BQ97_9AGAR|nr:eliciting plant response-like protein [Cylindrobasidium torrendii FP15055 ss-10]